MPGPRLSAGFQGLGDVAGGGAAAAIMRSLSSQAGLVAGRVLDHLDHGPAQDLRALLDEVSVGNLQVRLMVRWGHPGPLQRWPGLGNG
jgi:hypothetical protein